MVNTSVAETTVVVDRIKDSSGKRQQEVIGAHHCLDSVYQANRPHEPPVQDGEGECEVGTVRWGLGV